MPILFSEKNQTKAKHPFAIIEEIFKILCTSLPTVINYNFGPLTYPLTLKKNKHLIMGGKT